MNKGVFVIDGDTLGATDQKLPELSLLRELKNPPEKLFYQGNWNPTIFENCAAVVGSRRITDYGRSAVKKLVLELVGRGITIVSGFMYGVDQCAHEAAIEFGGRTIAVLGWGVNWKLIGKDKILAGKIIESGGLMLSEWQDQEPTRWTFPLRNRIVAALSGAIYVVEAAEESGSMITVGKAEKLGRKIYAVPGPITSGVSAGTNKLIASGRAMVWTPSRETAVNKNSDSTVLRLIKEQGGLTVDEMSRILALSVGEIGAELTELLLFGMVVEREGKYYLI